jgi:hypothetical protein
VSELGSHDRDRALAILAEHPEGFTRASMLAHGVAIGLLNQLIRSGLATWRIRRGKQPREKAMDTVRVKITEAGRHTLTKQITPPTAKPKHLAMVSSSSRPLNSRHRVLRLLASSDNGHTEPNLLARGFSEELLAGLLKDGLATRGTERVGRNYPVEVTRVKITEAGRRALQ